MHGQWAGSGRGQTHLQPSLSSVSSIQALTARGCLHSWRQHLWGPEHCLATLVKTARHQMSATHACQWKPQVPMDSTLRLLSVLCWKTQNPVVPIRDASGGDRAHLQIVTAPTSTVLIRLTVGGGVSWVNDVGAFASAQSPGWGSVARYVINSNSFPTGGAPTAALSVQPTGGSLRIDFPPGYNYSAGATYTIVYQLLINGVSYAVLVSTCRLGCMSARRS